MYLVQENLEAINARIKFSHE
uniref:Uncharacterized protein n=1 Tax=Ralstonia solanacearum TaxID=305 RepID=A0A0S4WU96_RALSL|nr:protein of unknown function [Ralstonia solanacearum]